MPYSVTLLCANAGTLPTSAAPITTAFALLVLLFILLTSVLLVLLLFGFFNRSGGDVFHSFSIRFFICSINDLDCRVPVTPSGAAPRADPIDHLFRVSRICGYLGIRRYLSGVHFR
jgi:hypothetical protein